MRSSHLLVSTLRRVSRNANSSLLSRFPSTSLSLTYISHFHNSYSHLPSFSSSYHSTSFPSPSHPRLFSSSPSPPSPPPLSSLHAQSHFNSINDYISTITNFIRSDKYDITNSEHMESSIHLSHLHSLRGNYLMAVDTLLYSLVGNKNKDPKYNIKSLYLSNVTQPSTLSSLPHHLFISDVLNRLLSILPLPPTNRTKSGDIFTFRLVGIDNSTVDPLSLSKAIISLLSDIITSPHSKVSDKLSLSVFVSLFDFHLKFHDDNSMNLFVSNMTILWGKSVFSGNDKMSIRRRCLLHMWEGILMGRKGENIQRDKRFEEGSEIIQKALIPTVFTSSPSDSSSSPVLSLSDYDYTMFDLRLLSLFSQLKAGTSSTSSPLFQQILPLILPLSPSSSSTPSTASLLSIYNPEVWRIIFDEYEFHAMNNDMDSVTSMNNSIIHHILQQWNPPLLSIRFSPHSPLSCYPFIFQCIPILDRWAKLLFQMGNVELSRKFFEFTVNLIEHQPHSIQMVTLYGTLQGKESTPPSVQSSEKEQISLPSSSSILSSPLFSLSVSSPFSFSLSFSSRLLLLSPRYNDLGICLMRLKSYPESKSAIEKSLQMKSILAYGAIALPGQGVEKGKSIVDDNALDMLSSYHNLGLLEHYTHNYTDSETLLLTALWISLRKMNFTLSLNGQAPSNGFKENDMKVFLQSGQLTSMVIKKLSEDGNNGTLANTWKEIHSFASLLNNLGELFTSMKKWEMAEASLHTALQIKQHLVKEIEKEKAKSPPVPPSSPSSPSPPPSSSSFPSFTPLDFLYEVHQLGLNLNHQQKFTPALLHYDSFYQQLLSQYGTHHISISIVLGWTANVHMAENQWEKASDTLRKALDIAERYIANNGKGTGGGENNMTTPSQYNQLLLTFRGRLIDVLKKRGLDDEVKILQRKQFYDNKNYSQQIKE